MNKVRFVVAFSLAGTAAGCAAVDDASDDVDWSEAAGTVSQGTVSQGTVSQGTVSQGTVSQGSDNAVWGFSLSGWTKNGMSLKSPVVSNGTIVAWWDKTARCTSWLDIFRGPLRECGWYGGGRTSCTPGTTMKVGAGGELGYSSSQWMLRICHGDAPCRFGEAIAGSVNASVSFTCPADGQIFAMVAPRDPSVTSFSYYVQSSPSRFFSNRVNGLLLKGVEMSGIRGEGTYVTERYTIETVDVGAPGSNTDHYTLKRTSDGQPLCMPKFQSGDIRAIPLTGEWYLGSSWVGQYSSSRFSFGCSAGVLSKCYEHGYRPWATWGGVPLRDYHQTCTRAARADFCGDGKSYTVTGTTIDLSDDLGISPEDQQQPQLSVEAMWVRDSYPFYLGGDGWYNYENRRVACLAKKRWDTLPFDPCVSIKNDPRTTCDPKDKSSTCNVSYCDEVPVSTWLAREDVLEATRSAYIDAGLWQWERSDTHYHRTTTQLTTTAGQPAGYEWRPTKGGPTDPPVTPVFLGAVFKVGTSDPVRPLNTTIPLYSYYNPTTRAYLTTTADTPPAGYGSRTTEGYIYKPSCAPNCPTAKLLVQYQSNGETITTLSKYAPGGATTTTLGYLPR